MRYLRTAMFAIAIACAAVQTASASERPFGTAFKIPSGDLVEKWGLVNARMTTDLGRIESCEMSPDECHPDVKKAIDTFGGIVDVVRGKKGLALLNAVRVAVKRKLTYASDEKRFGGDKWLSPFDTLSQGNKGDCEDYAILMIAVLKAVGVPADDLALVTLKWGVNVHAAAAIRQDGGWYFIDNLAPDVMPESLVARHYTPLSFSNHAGSWLYVGKAKTIASVR